MLNTSLLQTLSFKLINKIKKTPDFTFLVKVLRVICRLIGMSKGEIMSERYGRKTVLFLCIHNSSRTQMAEAFMNNLYGEWFKAYSAGTKEGKSIDPYAEKVMAEIGIDISKQKPKSMNSFKGQKFNYLITVCNNLKAVCPSFPGGTVCRHWTIKDPEMSYGTEQHKLAVYREVRDEIRYQIEMLFGSLWSNEPLAESHK